MRVREESCGLGSSTSDENDKEDNAMVMREVSFEARWRQTRTTYRFGNVPCVVPSVTICT